MKLKDFIKLINNFKIRNTDKIWLLENKKQFLDFIHSYPILREKFSGGRLASSSLWRLSYQVAAGVVIIMLLFFGIGQTKVTASFNISPTNPLYSVKLTAEKLEGLLIFDDAKKLNFVIQLAQKRMEELQRTIEQENGQMDIKVINKILEQYSQLMDQVSENIDKVASKGDNKTLLSAAKKLQSSKPTSVLNKVTNKENSSAVLSAEEAALATEGKAVEALKQLEEEQREQVKKEAEDRINALYATVVQLQELMNQAKSLKGYVVLGNAYSKLEKAQQLLEQARNYYQKGNFLLSIDAANEGSQQALEVKRELFRILDQELDDSSSSSESE